MATKQLAHESIRASESDSRLAELMLYVGMKCQDDPYFGATKLNKILFYADFNAYLKLGKPITGATYMRLNQGPVPKRLLPVQTRLIEKQHLAVQSRTIGAKIQKRSIPLRDADLSGFSAAEIALLDEIITTCNGHNATAVSVASHNHTCWKIASDKSDIPYEAAFLSDTDVPEHIKSQIIKRAQKLNWNVF